MTELAGLCTCFAIRRAARHLSQAYDRCLAPSGLRTSQFSLLNRVAASGPVGIQALARDMGLDRTTMGRNLRPLEREGLVTIEVDEKDRRGRMLHITPKGEARRRAASRLWAAAQARFHEVYGQTQTQELHRTLQNLATIDLQP